MSLAGMSGIPSAVGRCIESTFRTVPITSITGNRNSIGVASTNPHRFKIIDPGGGMEGIPEIEAPHDEIDGNIQLLRTILTGKNYGGEFGFKGDGENLYDTLLGIFGRDVQTQVAGAASTSITSVYKHAFIPNIYLPSWTVEEIFGDANYGRLTSGVVVSEVDLDFGAIVTARERMIGYRQIPNKYGDTQYNFGSATSNLLPTEMGGDGTKTVERTATPTYVDVAQLNNGNGPFVFAGLGFGTETGHSANYLLIDGSGVSANILPGIRLNLRRNVESFMVAGSGFDRGATVANQLEVTGSLLALFQDLTFPLAALSHSRIALNFGVDGIYIGSSAVKYRIEVHIPHAKFTRNPLVIPGGAIQVGGDFVAKYDATAGYAIKITLTNTVTNASLGGGAGTGGDAGGLGGWSLSG